MNTTTTYQFVTDNSVYEVIDHAFSPGVSVRNRTRDGHMSGDFEVAGSAWVGLYYSTLVLFIADRDGTLMLRSSAIQSIVRITSSDSRRPSNFVPVPHSGWGKLRLVGVPFDRSYTDRRTTSLA